MPRGAGVSCCWLYSLPLPAQAKIINLPPFRNPKPIRRSVKFLALEPISYSICAFMSDPAVVLREFKPAKPFFIGIDSDGCVFDSMEIKHKECFAPMFIKYFDLQAVSKYAREVWEFVNLYSKTRGANRFPALVRALNLLRERPEVKARGVKVPDTKALDEWIARETKLGNATLAAEVKRGNTGLAQVKEWSDAVNRAIEDIVKGVPPFPLFRESLDEAFGEQVCIGNYKYRVPGRTELSALLGITSLRRSHEHLRLPIALHVTNALSDTSGRPDGRP